MDEDKRNELRAGLEQAIESGSIADASPEQLQRWLISLSTGRIPNQTVHPREIIRGITINHIQMARTIRQLEKTIEQLDADNRRTQRLVIILAIIAIVVGIIQAVTSIIPLFHR
jgi:hypothetical protein